MCILHVNFGWLSNTLSLRQHLPQPHLTLNLLLVLPVYQLHQALVLSLCLEYSLRLTHSAFINHHDSSSALRHVCLLFIDLKSNIDPWRGSLNGDERSNLFAKYFPLQAIVTRAFVGRWGWVGVCDTNQTFIWGRWDAYLRELEATDWEVFWIVKVHVLVVVWFRGVSSTLLEGSIH